MQVDDEAARRRSPGFSQPSGSASSAQRATWNMEHVVNRPHPVFKDGGCLRLIAPRPHNLTVSPVRTSMLDTTGLGCFNYSRACQ